MDSLNLSSAGKGQTTVILLTIKDTATITFFSFITVLVPQYGSPKELWSPSLLNRQVPSLLIPELVEVAKAAAAKAHIYRNKFRHSVGG